MIDTTGNFTIPPRDDFLWYGVDLDGTIAEQIWDKDDPSTWFTIGTPIWENIRKLLEVHRAGYKILIHTARPWDHYELVESWLDKYEIPYKGIVMGKFNCHRFVDDKAISAYADTWLET